MNRVFILGAGASRFAGYPIGLEMWRFVCDLSGGSVLAEQRRDAVIPEIERILKFIPPPDHDAPNLEELFTLLDLAELGVAPLELARLEWRPVRQKLMGMIAEAFQWHEYRLQRDLIYTEHDHHLSLSRELVLSTLGAWTNYLRPGDTIITFNWDILHEAALWRVGKWHYAGGYGFLPGDEASEKESAITVLKMHGSVNWAQSDQRDTRPTIQHKMDFFRGALDGADTYHIARGQWNEGRHLIVPTYLKDLSTNRLLLALWNQAFEALRTADSITVIGYQLHRADAPARQLIASAIVQNGALKEIVVIAPDGGGINWDTFCLDLGLVRRPVFMKFEEWVQRPQNTPISSKPLVDERGTEGKRRGGISAFERYIGIDYSGAKTPTSSLKGLRVYIADRASSPVEVQPPPSPRKYWTRRGIALWLVERISENQPTLVGIDHGFSFPLQYFKQYNLPHNWPAFLDDFQRHWPTDEDNTYVDFVRGGSVGNGPARSGDSTWRRLTEKRAVAAKSVFHFDVPGSVAKSTHAGLPWLRYIHKKLGDRIHFWPFDGWDIPAGRSVVAEVYPSLWSQGFACEGRTADQHDAYAVAAWMRRADLDGSLAEYFAPSLPAEERKRAEIEGWILGIK